MRRFFVGLMVVGLLFAAAPANATPPQRETERFSFSLSADCGSFVDNYQGTGTIRVTTFFKADGDAIVEHFRVMQRETDTNSVTGKTIRVNSSWTEMADLQTGITRTAGQTFMGVGKGANVIHETGLLVLDRDGSLIRVAGPHTVLEGGAEPFCQALS
jgi:hypothetical protein